MFKNYNKGKELVEQALSWNWDIKMGKMGFSKK
jgi:hypothetical protein